MDDVGGALGALAAFANGVTEMAASVSSDLARLSAQATETREAVEGARSAAMSSGITGGAAGSEPDGQVGSSTTAGALGDVVASLTQQAGRR